MGLSFVVGKGAIVLSNNLVLKSVLHVSNLFCSLISISKLTHHLNCCAKFPQTHSVFQELCSGMRIDNAKELEGLFILEEEAEKIPKALQCERSFNNEIMLWHSRLGHPIFACLKKLFPSLFLNKNVTNYQCEVC